MKITKFSILIFWFLVSANIFGSLQGTWLLDFSGFSNNFSVLSFQKFSKEATSITFFVAKDRPFPQVYDRLSSGERKIIEDLKAFCIDEGLQQAKVVLRQNSLHPKINHIDTFFEGIGTGHTHLFFEEPIEEDLLKKIIALLNLENYEAGILESFVEWDEKLTQVTYKVPFTQEEKDKVAQEKLQIEERLRAQRASKKRKCQGDKQGEIDKRPRQRDTLNKSFGSWLAAAMKKIFRK